MRKIYFHEDDYCQLEVLPLAARQFCLQEMGEIDAFAEEHREGPFIRICICGRPARNLCGS